jgi:hypothetical protein
VVQRKVHSDVQKKDTKASAFDLPLDILPSILFCLVMLVIGIGAHHQPPQPHRPVVLLAALDLRVDDPFRIFDRSPKSCSESEYGEFLADDPPRELGVRFSFILDVFSAPFWTLYPGLFVLPNTRGCDVSAIRGEKAIRGRALCPISVKGMFLNPSNDILGFWGTRSGKRVGCG